MKSFKLIIFCILASVCLYITSSKAQTKEAWAKDSSIRVITLDTSPVAKYIKIYHLTRDTTGMYPTRVDIVKGKIVAVSPFGTSCGVICGCGTFKIHLDQDILLYPKEDVYMAIMCFNGKKADYLNKSIDIKVVLLTEKGGCYSNGGLNCIDSKGVPYYIPNEMEGKMKVY